jgi:1,4-dihydroxy-2-naphthoyl-CoA synthase
MARLVDLTRRAALREPRLVTGARRRTQLADPPLSKEAQLSDFVKIERGLGPDGRIALERFDRGNGVNALSPEAIRQLTDAARSFEEEADTSVVILAGNAEAFSAGFDLKDPEGRCYRVP